MLAADPAEPLAPASRLDLHQEWLRLQSVQWRIVVMLYSRSLKPFFSESAVHTGWRCAVTQAHGDILEVHMHTHRRRSPQGQFALKVTGLMVIAALSFAIPLLFI
ncbi:hypothetical protein GCM10022265_41410 [Marinobacter xestospongiae]